MPVLQGHPALLDTDAIEHPFHYMEMVETFFRAAAEYIVEYDPETEIARFTHIPSGQYVVMARDLQKLNRPDKALPWGMLRVRVLVKDRKGEYKFATKQISDDAMRAIIQNDNAPYYVKGLSVQCGEFAGIIHYNSPINFHTAQRCRDFQYDRMTELAAQRVMSDEQSIQQQFEEGEDEPTAPHHPDAV